MQIEEADRLLKGMHIGDMSENLAPWADLGKNLQEDIKQVCTEACTVVCILDLGNTTSLQHYQYTDHKKFSTRKLIKLDTSEMSSFSYQLFKEQSVLKVRVYGSTFMVAHVLQNNNHAILLGSDIAAILNAYDIKKINY